MMLMSQQCTTAAFPQTRSLQRQLLLPSRAGHSAPPWRRHRRPIATRAAAAAAAAPLKARLQQQLLLPAAARRGSRVLGAVPQQQEQEQQTQREGAARAAIRVGSRGSKLARLQAEQVQLLLRKVRPEWGPEAFETVAITTHGDKESEGALRDLGQGAFTEVIDRAVAGGEVDIGVHSLKDAPVKLPDGVALAACLPRDEPRDALISLKARTLAELPHGARVGTSSMRRKAQLLHAHPHLNVVPVRGNIDHRLQLLQRGELDAIVLAAAGLSRLGQEALITRVLDFDEMLPAACQGAIGVTCSAKDPFIAWELGLICHEPTRLEVAAERAMLAALLAPPPPEGPEEGKAEAGTQAGSGSGSGSAPAPPPPPTTAPSPKGISAITGLPLLPGFAVACHAGFDPHEGLLKLEGLVASEDGRTLHRLSATEGAASPADAEHIGAQLGRRLRAFALQHGWVEEE